MGIYGIEDESSVDWEKLYKFCGVHFQRSVERVKTNFNVVPFEWTKISGTKYPLVSSFIRIGCVCYIFGLLVLFVGLLLH